MEAYGKLIGRMDDLQHLHSTMAVLGWDQQCYMPPGGIGERAAQFSLLSRLSHEWLVSDETHNLLQSAESETRGMDTDSNEALTVRAVRRDFDKASKIPTALVTELAEATTVAHEDLGRSRGQNPTSPNSRRP